MKTMLSVAYNFLYDKEEATFKQIWKEIIKQMKPLWKKYFVNMSQQEIEDMQISEFYTLLTIDGRFTKNKNDKWILIEKYTYEEVKQMKINIGESLE